jgi:hypothetical protein
MLLRFRVLHRRDPVFAFQHFVQNYRQTDHHDDETTGLLLRSHVAPFDLEVDLLRCACFLNEGKRAISIESIIYLPAFFPIPKHTVNSISGKTDSSSGILLVHANVSSFKLSQSCWHCACTPFTNKKKKGRKGDRSTCNVHFKSPNTHLNHTLHT